ncbi:hypothetical protein Barb4_02581 [Bacteroidales bacterium Barb4]|nr:hypothetical protein Barb4_02581 [Bacteroidales bacterium Barb4]
MHGAVHVDKLGFSREGSMVACVIVYDFDVVPHRIPLDVQRFVALLAAEIGGSRVEIIVVGLPYHGRPGRMAHPEEHTAAELAASLKDAAIAVIVHPLRPFGELTGILRFAEGFFNDVIESGGRLGTAQRIVVQSPETVLRPELVGRQGLGEAFIRHYVWHTAFAVETVVAEEQVIVARGQGTVGSSPTHHACGGMGNVVNARMQGGKQGAKVFVKRIGRIAFVTTDVEGDGRMIADALHEVVGIGHKEVVVIRYRPVVGVGKPEVLPDHYAVVVAGFVKLFIANLSHPVAYHGEVHIGVIGDSNVVFAPAIVEVGLAEAPVSPASDEAATVYEKAQYAVVLIEGHLAHAGFEVFLIRCTSTDVKAQFHIVEVLIAVAFRPPQGRVLKFQGSMCGRVQRNGLRFGGGKRYFLLKGDCAVETFQLAGHGFARMVFESYIYHYIGRCGIRQRQFGADKGVFNRHGTGMRQENIIPYTDVTPANGRNPVPADGGMKGWIVSTEYATVLVGTESRLFLDRPHMGVLDNFNSKHVRFAGSNKLRHIKLAAHKAAIDTPYLRSVQEDIGFPIDTVEVEEQAFTRKVGRNVKRIAIPEVGVKEGLGDLQLVIPVVGVRQGTDAPIACQYSTGHSGRYPFRLTGKVRCRDVFAGGIHQRSPLHLPIPRRQKESVVLCRRHCLRTRNKSAFPLYFQFTQKVRLIVFRLCHQDADIAGFGGFIKRQRIRPFRSAGEGGKVCPHLGIVGNLHRSGYGFIDPVKIDLVEGSRHTQIHIHPFLTRAGTHPRTVEILRRSNQQQFFPLVKVPIAKRPILCTFHFQADVVEGIIRRLGQRKRLVQ